MLYFINFVLLFSLLASFLNKRFRIPYIVSMIFFGLGMNLPYLQNIFFIGDNLHNLDTLGVLSNIWLIFLMLNAWLWSSIKKMKKEIKESVYISIFGFLVPLILWTGVLLLLWYPLQISIIIWICLSITAEWTTAEVLFWLNKLKSRVWTIMLESGIIDDIVWILAFVGITLLLWKFNLSEMLLVVGSLFAFALWSILANKLWRKCRIIDKVEYFSNLLFVPFFFVNIWINFSFDVFNISILLVVILLFVAIVSKLIGTFIWASFDHLSRAQTWLVWWAMNSRGAIWLAIILIVYKFWLIDSNLYSAFVIVTLVTTIIFPIVAEIKIKNNKKIMN